MTFPGLSVSHIPDAFERSRQPPEFRLVQLHPTRFELSLEPWNPDTQVIARFFVPPGQPSPVGTIFLDSRDTSAVNFGEQDWWYILANRQSAKKFYLTIGCAMTPALTWLLIQYVQPNPNFITEFCGRRGIRHCDRSILCRTTKCNCEFFELRRLFDSIIATGFARCPGCQNNVLLTDVMVSVEQPKPPLVLPLPGRNRGGRQEVVTETAKVYTEWTPIPTKEESPQLNDTRKLLGRILAQKSISRRPKIRLAELVAELNSSDRPVPDPYREPESYEDYCAEIQALGE
jgi:hypothetical protein